MATDPAAATSAGRNPYAAPVAIVEDAAGRDDADFDPGGVVVPAIRGIDWIARGWRAFMNAPGPWAAIAAAFALLSLALQIVPFVGPVVAAVVTPCLVGGMMLGCRALERGDRLRFVHLFEGFSAAAGPLLAIGALQFAALFVMVLVTGVAAALLIPFLGFGAASAIFVAAIVLGVVTFALVALLLTAVWFAPALVAINSLGAIDAMRSSLVVSFRNWRALAVYGLALLVAAIPFVALFGLVVGGGVAGAMQSGGSGVNLVMLFAGFTLLSLVVALVVVPVLMGSMYAGYRDIFHRDPAA